MNSPRNRRRGGRGFTLVEILVVLAIIALISAVALPTILPALNERRVSEAARELQAAIAGTRDAAIRANAPRGIRLLPDPILSPVPYGSGDLGVLTSNRFVTIEPAPDYHEGLIVAIPAATSGLFLQVEQSLNSTISGVRVPNEPTGWYFNIRQGDKIRFNDSGAYYTIAGPLFTGPFYNPSASQTRFLNTERYINLTNPDPSTYTSPPFAWAPVGLDFLNLTNGVDDDHDGWVDEGFDGIDNDGDGIVDPGYNGLDDAGIVNGVAYPRNGIIDEPNELLIGQEFEQEVFLGNPPSFANPSNYTIFRRPIVSPGAREVTLPEGIVIDMTTWNAPSATPVTTANQNTTNFKIQFPERSRVPVDPYTYFVDIMVAPSGQVVQAGAGSAGIDQNNSSPTSNLPFYHFWLTEREGVVAPIGTPQSTSPYIPARNPNYPTQTYLLPMPKGTPNYSPPATQIPLYLTGERRLITLFTRSGQVVTNTIEIFDGNDTNLPYYDAQAGIKETQ